MNLERSSSTTINLEEGTETTYADVVGGRLPERETFQTQVLSLLGSLKTDMQSMGERVSELERQRAQSALPTTPKGKGKRKAPPCGVNEAAAFAPRAPPLGTCTRQGAEADDDSCDDGERTERPRAHSTSPSPAEDTPVAASSKHWADRDDEIMDYSAELVWDDDEEEEPADTKGIKLFKVTERTERFLGNAFSSAVPNATRRQWREKYGAPNTTVTACPNLDKVIKSRLPATTKSRDRQLAKQQALMLDAVGPVTYILEEAAKGQLNQKAVIDAAQTALRLLGNASVHASRERRKNAMQSMNPRLLDMADDDSIYKSAAPSLFGEGFCKKAKERDDELKCLNMATVKTTGAPRDTHFFRGGRFYKQSRGNGPNFRGRRGGYQRQHPYKQVDTQWPRRQESKKTQNL